MSKTIFTISVLPLILLLGGSSGNYAAQSKQERANATTGTFQKLIVQDGSVTIALDLNRLNGISSMPGKPATLNFAVAANSFFPVLVFNDLLRGPAPGSIALVPSQSRGTPALPRALGASVKRLVVEKLPSGHGSDLAVRDSNTGFTFFNIQG